MTPDRRHLIERLYHEALARDARDRPAFLAPACGGHATLRRDVGSLLAPPASAEGPLDPAALAAAEVW